VVISKFLILIFIISSRIIVAQDTSQYYVCQAKWYTDTVDLELNLFKFNPVVFYNRESKIVRQQNFLNGAKMLDVKLIGIDSIIDSNNGLTFYKYYENAKTFYSDGTLRTKFRSTRKKIKSTSYTREGRVLFRNLIKIKKETRDTIRGIFKVETYYDWIQFDVFQKGEKILKIQVPVNSRFGASIDSTRSNSQINDDCQDKFSVIRLYKELGEGEKEKLLKKVLKAADCELITGYEACYYL
jgi:hypothetical protein